MGNASDAIQFNLLATNIGTAFNSTYYSKWFLFHRFADRECPAAVSGHRQSDQSGGRDGGADREYYSKGLTCGEIGHRYLLRALTDMGRPDVVFNLHSGTNDPGYGYILNQGATALTEAWDANPAIRKTTSCSAISPNGSITTSRESNTIRPCRVSSMSSSSRHSSVASPGSTPAMLPFAEPLPVTWTLTNNSGDAQCHHSCWLDWLNLFAHAGQPP